MTLVATHQPPDLVMLDKEEDGTLIVRVGDKKVPIRNPGRRQGDSLSEIIISVGDLRTLVAAGYKSGWHGKVLHIKQLREDEYKEIGS